MNYNKKDNTSLKILKRNYCNDNVEYQYFLKIKKKYKNNKEKRIRLYDWEVCIDINVYEEFLEKYYIKYPIEIGLQLTSDNYEWEENRCTKKATAYYIRPLKVNNDNELYDYINRNINIPEWCECRLYNIEIIFYNSENILKKE